MLLEEGASPQQVDAAIEKFGFAMGPFRMSDLAGNDISWHIRQRHYAEHPKQRKMRIADRVCELGRFGQKTGLGWYRYEAGKRDAIPDPVVDKIIDEERKALKIVPRKIPDAEIVDRLLYALVNEGAQHPARKASRSAPPTSTWCTWRVTDFRCSAAGRCSTPSRVGLGQVVRRMKQFAQPTCEPRSGSRRSSSQLAADGTRHSTMRRRANGKGEASVVDAVIVSTARTALAKSWRGAFNLTHGATLGAHVVKHAMERAKLDPGRGRRRAHGLRQSRRRHRLQHRAADCAARRLSRSRPRA